MLARLLHILVAIRYLRTNSEFQKTKGSLVYVTKVPVVTLSAAKGLAYRLKPHFASRGTGPGSSQILRLRLRMTEGIN